jgi:hypothetical protein
MRPHACSNDLPMTPISSVTEATDACKRGSLVAIFSFLLVSTALAILNADQPVPGDWVRCGAASGINGNARGPCGTRVSVTLDSNGQHSETIQTAVPKSCRERTHQCLETVTYDADQPGLAVRQRDSASKSYVVYLTRPAARARTASPIGPSRGPQTGPHHHQQTCARQRS